MHVNIYSQELTDEVTLLEKKRADGTTIYQGVCLYLHSSELLRHPPEGDDRSAVVIWLPRSEQRRDMLASALHEMARLVMTAAPDIGID